MALTKVSRGLLSTSIVDNGNATAITIDSSENVGIGTTSPTYKLETKDGDIATVKLTSAAGGNPVNGMRFRVLNSANTAQSATLGMINGETVNSWGGVLTFSTKPANGTPNEAVTERLRIDALGGITGTSQAGGHVVFNSNTTDSDFRVAWNSGTHALYVDGATGNVGIGEADPDSTLTVKGASHTNFQVKSNSESTKAFIQTVQDSDVRIGSSTNHPVSFYQNGTERMRLSGGNLLVGKTSADIGATAGIELYAQANKLAVTRASGVTASFNLLTNDGTIVDFKKDGTAVGSIGSRSGNLFTTYTSNGYGLSGTHVNNGIIPVLNGISADNIVDLGNGGVRYDDIFATNGTINTSDRNEKQDIEELSDAEQRVAVACKGLLRKFRWINSVETKGDEARIHFGIIAQDLQAAFEAEGLDAGRYAMFTSNTWTDEETGEERTRLGVRYSELLAFIISAI